jgi:hypothetical protein
MFGDCVAGIGVAQCLGYVDAAEEELFALLHDANLSKLDIAKDFYRSAHFYASLI